MDNTADKRFIVGADITAEDINDFYYTIDSSTFPPYFLRFRFYREEGKEIFFYEERKGNHWPLEETDRKSCGTAELNEEEWNSFYEYLKEGTVRAREELLESGDSGPWMYLYWNKDEAVYQEFRFASYQKRLEFEEFCSKLKKSKRRKLILNIKRQK